MMPAKMQAGEILWDRTHVGCIQLAVPVQDAALSRDAAGWKLPSDLVYSLLDCGLVSGWCYV